MKAFFQGITRLLVGFCCTIICLIVLFQVKEVRSTLLNAISDSVAYKTGWSFEVGEVEGLLPLELKVRQLTVKYHGKVFCEMDRFAFIISPFDLLRGSLVFSQLELSGIQAELQELQQLTIRGRVCCHTLKMALDSKLTVQDNEGHSVALAIMAQSDQWNVHVREGSQGYLHHFYDLDIPLPLDLTITVNPLTSLAEFQVASEFMNRSVFLQGSCSYDSEQILCDHLQGEIPDLDIAFEGHLNYELASQFVRGQIDLHPLPLTEFSGILDSSLMFRGPLRQLSLTFTASSPRLEIENVVFEKVRSQAILDLHEIGLDGDWIVTGQINSLPVKINFHSALTQSIEISEFFASFSSGSISGTGHYDEGLFCHLEGNIQDLSKLTTPFDFPVTGTALFKCDISPETEKILILGTGIEWQNCSLEKVTYQQESQGFLNGHYSFSAHHVNWNDMRWNELSIGTSIDQNQMTWPFSITATGQKEDHVEVDASGQWHKDSCETFVHIGKLSGTLFAHPFELENPVNFYVTEKTCRSTLVNLNVEQGTITFEGELEGEEVNALLDIKHLPIDLANHLLPQSLGIDGDVSLFLRLTGPADNIQGSMVLQGEELQIYDESLAKLPLSSGKLEAVLTDNQMTFEGRLSNPENPVYAKGVIPLTFSLYPFQWELSPREPIRTHVTTSGEISPYLKLFVTDTTNVEGHIDIDIDIGGTVERPIVEGRANLKNGVFESLNTGVVVKDLECSLIGNDKKLILDHLSGNDGGSGTLTATGTFELSQEKNYPFDLQVNLDNAVVVRLDYADMATTGTVTLTGDQKRGLVTGDVTVDRVNLQIPDQLPVQMKTVNVTFINDPEEKNPPLPVKSKEPWPIDLDIHFNVPSNFFVTGRDLESEWQGDFSFSGTTFEPKVHGTLQLIRGEYSFNGKSFTSTQGSVNFAGDPATKTTIYVVGEQPIDNMKVQAILKGDLSEPSLSFRSNPSMSEKEILSWILFGHGIDEITPFQKAQLSESVFTLSSGENGDVISQLRRDMGIDRLDLSSHETDERNELSLRIGKYISRGIYVSLSKSINAEANQVAIEANITRHLKVQAEVGDNAEGKMSLKWARDY